MTYGRLIYGNNPKAGPHQLINIGDYFQTFAIDALLKSCDIPSASFTNVERHKIREAANLVLPLSGVFTHMRGRKAFPLSPSVSPLFFGYNNHAKISSAERRAYQKAGIIGCRDQATTNRLKRNGFPAYLVGCATLALATRTAAPKRPKVFFVDVPEKLEPYIPKKLVKNAVYLTQEVAFSGENTPAKLQAIEAYAKARLTQYKEEAGLVVTSRLHCAAPCLAMGIPVILVRDYFDERYGFIDQFLPLYTPDRFGNIDWSAKAPDTTTIKQLLQTAFCAAVTDSPKKESAFKVLDDFYMQRKRADYRTPLKTTFFYLGLRFFPRFSTTLRNKWLKRFTVINHR